MRDISRKSKQKPAPPPPKSKKPKVSAPAPTPAPVQPPSLPPPSPMQVVGYIHKDGDKKWQAYIGDKHAAIALVSMEVPTRLMREAMAWVVNTCKVKDLNLKEVVKL